MGVQTGHQPTAAAAGADELQRQLRDLLCLAVVGDHVRWVLADRDGELAEWLAEAVPRWRALAERVAERLVALGVPPDGRVRALAEDIHVNWVPAGWLSRDEAADLIDRRLHNLGGWARLTQSETADAETAELLDRVAAGLSECSPLGGATRPSSHFG